MILGFLFCFSTASQAQLVPDYMGKRHVLEVGGTLGLNHSEPWQAVVTKAFKGNTSFLPIAFRPELSYNYVLGRDLNTRVAYAFSSFNFSTRPISYNDPRLLFTEYNVFVHDFSVGIDFYPHKHKPLLAPIGGFWRLGVHVAHTKGNLTEAFTYSGNVEGEATVYNAIGVKVGYGIRAVLNNHFSLSFTIQTILFPALFADPPRGNVYKDSLRIILQERSMIGLSISLGVLL